MESSKYDVVVLRTSSFRSLYDGVRDMVFLYHIAGGTVIEGNTLFRATLGLAGHSAFSLPLQQFIAAEPGPELLPGKIINTAFSLPGGEQVPVQLQWQQVLLEQEPALLGIAWKQPDADAAKIALAAAEAEKKTLLKEVYHRVKNNLNIIISLMSLQLNRVQEPQLRHMLMESKSRVYTLALLQERLYHSPRISEVKANEYLLSLTHAVIATFKGNRQQIGLVPHMQECWLNVDVLVPLGLIVHELVCNAVLHAYKEQQGDIHLHFGFTSAGECRLVVQDGGKGLPDGSSFANFKTLGAQLVISLSRQLKARLEVESSPGGGTKVSLFFLVPANYA